jgi:hypothetical protein
MKYSAMATGWTSKQVAQDPFGTHASNPQGFELQGAG